MMGTYLSFYFYFFLKAKTQISALVEFTESFLQYQQGIPLEIHNGFKSTKSLLKVGVFLYGPPTRLILRSITFSKARNENSTVPINKTLIKQYLLLYKRIFLKYHSNLSL